MMDLPANPVPQKGMRNIWCPFYNGCLDHAIHQAWRSWNCSQCQNRMSIETTYEDGVISCQLSEYYDTPKNILRLVE
jgi:hypothetical protein